MTIEDICWICRSGPADSGEHILKRSDLDSQFGPSSLFYHSDTSRNVSIQSNNSKILKHKSICAHCNSSRTQDHDRAWASLSIFFQENITELPDGSCVRFSRIFDEPWREKVLAAHLYMAKHVGCTIKRFGFDVDTTPLAEAVVNGRPSEQVFLSPARVSGLNVPTVQIAGLQSVKSQLNEEILLLAWAYVVGPVGFEVYWSKNGRIDGLDNAWSPLRYSRKIGVSTRPLRFLKNQEVPNTNRTIRSNNVT